MRVANKLDWLARDEETGSRVWGDDWFAIYREAIAETAAFCREGDTRRLQVDLLGHSGESSDYEGGGKEGSFLQGSWVPFGSDVELGLFDLEKHQILDRFSA